MLIESLQPHLQTQFELSSQLRRVAGTSAAVIGCGPVPWVATLAGPDGQTIVSADRFPIYSLTKTFVACAVMQLVEQGSLDLDGLVGLWLPELPFAYQITIRQLLNHTSGLPDYGATEAYQNSLKQCPTEPWTDEEFIAYTCGYRLRTTPGTTFNYSNIGYLYLRLILESVSGRPLSEVLQERIFVPLALRSTSVHTSLFDQRTLVAAQSRYFGQGEAADIRDFYHPGWVAHGLVASTAVDVATFYSRLFDGEETLLGYDSVAELAKLHPVKERHRFFRNPGYGLGVMGDERLTGSIYGHTGSGPGYCAAAYVLLNPYGDPITAVALVNGEGAEQAEGIVLDLLNIARER